MDVADATFVVTDTETTGTKPKENRVIEIGATKLKNGTIVDRFQQLVNPGQSIPGRITRLTGITTGMVFDAPPIAEVLPEYLAFLGDGIFTAHNLTFDQGFLDAELRRAGRDALSNETLCTLRLARRLLPGLKSKGLSRLAQFYQIDVDGRHRALGDAEATSVVLRRLLRKLAFEHEIETVSEVLAFQNRSYQTVRRVPAHIKDIRTNVLPDVPAEPGTYTLKNSNGTPLYIGKAKVLSDRLRSHFTAVESKAARKRTMLQKVRRVDWQTTSTELEAILRESHLIKDKNPWYNRAQRRYFSRPFIRLHQDQAFPTVSWSRTLVDDGAAYFGPVRNADRAEMVVDVVNTFFKLRECDDKQFRQGERCLYADMERCTAPCETRDEEVYEAVVKRVRAFLSGRDESVLDALRERMRAASAEQAFEKAADFRDRVEALETILEKQKIIGAPVRQRNAVLVHRSDSIGGADLLFVRFGRFQSALSCAVPPTGDDRIRLRDACRTHFTTDATPPDGLSKRAIHEIRLLSHWTYAHRDEIDVVRWSPDGPSIPEMVDLIVERMRAPVQA